MVPLAMAIVLSAVLICATLLALNLRQTYPLQAFVGTSGGARYQQALNSGCTPQYLAPTELGSTLYAVNCPLWVRL